MMLIGVVFGAVVVVVVLVVATVVVAGGSFCCGREVAFSSSAIGVNAIVWRRVVAAVVVDTSWNWSL